MRLGTKTIAPLAILVTTVLLVLEFLLLHFQEESLKQAIFKGIDGQAHIAAQGIGSFVSEDMRASGTIATLFPLKAFRKGKTAEIENYLKTVSTSFPQFRNGIFILDKNGKFIADYPSHAELRGQSFAYREYYRRTIQENKGIVGKPYKSARTGRPVLTFTAPVFDSNGKIIAITACSIDLLSQQALGGYRRQKFGTTGYLFIFDKERQLILHPDDNRLLTYVEAGRNRIMEAALKEGFEGGGETVNSQGVPMLTSVRQVSGTDWIVAVQVSQVEAYAPIIEARLRIAVISAAAILLVIIIGAIAIRRVTNPLRKLENVVSRISTELEETELKNAYSIDDSALGVLRKIHSRDEIGMLASSFLRMTEKLGHAVSSLHQAAADWKLTFNSVNEAVVTLDTQARIVRMNRAAEDLLRSSFNKARGQYVYNLIFGTDTPPKDWPEIAGLKQHINYKWSQKLEKPEGSFEFNMTPVMYHDTVTGAVLVMSDITERVKSEEQIREMAFYDRLTGLPNRFLLEDRINQTLFSVFRDGKKAAIMFLDLDHFKQINDNYGHDVGDNVLKEATGRISGCLRKNDTLSRLGGDEFVVVIQDIQDKQETDAIAQRIIEALEMPLIIKGHTLTISSSIGVAIAPDNGTDRETLVKNADMAMYRAKRLGRKNYQFFEEDM